MNEVLKLRSEIRSWLSDFRPCLTDMEAKYLRKKLDETREDPLGYFYLLYKLHKNPVKTRPVCSDCGSTVHALGQWVDEKLQPIVKAQRTYFKNSFELKERLDLLKLPPNASFFTYDAISMYTNIDTEDCIERLSEFLSKPANYIKFGYRPKALIAAIKIVMRNNRMRFGDVIAKQIRGIAMGMSPAPTIANLYVAIYELLKLLALLDAKWMLLLLRSIDDGLGIWLHDADPVEDARRWNEFQTLVNGGGLSWTFTHQSKSVNFMDLTLSIEDGRVISKLYSKPLALHLYIPPNSCHPPGVVTGLIMGNVLRIYMLCSRQSDIEEELRRFFEYLLDRGYQTQDILPRYSKAIDNAKLYLSRTPAYRAYLKREKLEASKRRVFLHLPFHPNNPPSHRLQSIWQERMFHPKNGRPLNYLKNIDEAPIPIDKLVIAYSRAPNLGELLSYRKICKRSGPKVSSFLD